MCDDATAEKLKSLPSVQGDGQQTWKNQMLPDKLELSYIFLGVPFHSLSKMGCSTVKYKDMGIPKVGRLGCAAEETGPDQERSWALCWGARTFSSKNQEYLKDFTWEAYYYSIWTGCPLWKVPWKAEGRPVCGLLWVIMSQETFWSSHCQRKPICWTVYTSAQNSHVLRPLQGAKKKKFRHGQTTLKRLLSLSHIPLPNSCQWWAVTKTFMGIFIHYWTEKNKHSRMAQERELWQPAPPWWGFLTSTQISSPGIHNLLGPRKDQDTGCSIQKGSMAQQKDKSRCTHPGHGFAAQLGKVLIFL